MLFFGILITLVAVYSPFAVDSTMYAVDMNAAVIRQQHLRGNIIDYCIDDYLYVLTKRFLYKLDPDDLLIIDRTILPQTYTSMCTNPTKIFLISAGEIVILAKAHLAYETGIGMRFGDIRPMTSSQGRALAPDNTTLYVMEDKGTISVIKIIDLASGNVRKTLSVPRISTYAYDMQTRTFTTFDIQDQLTTYDLGLTKTGITVLPFAIDWFSARTYGFCIGTTDAVYLITKQGTIIDFQPLVADVGRSYDDHIYITNRDIVRIDSLTLRVNAVVPNNQGITRLLSVDHPSFVVGMNRDRAFYFINKTSMDIQPRAQEESIEADIRPETAPPGTDSLWYLQLGAFSNYENAGNLYLELCARALPVFIDTAEVYRVKFGGFFDKQLGVHIAEGLHLNGWFSLQKKVPILEHADFYIGTERFMLKDGSITRSEP